MAVIDHFVNNLIDEHKVLANAFFVENATIVSEDFHHTVQNVENRRWLNVVLRGGDKVDAEFLCEEIVDAINVLKRGFK